jgi:HPt (histidine-containing phosphotransfer) domain-containing protein
VVILEVEVSEAAVFVREHVLNERAQGLVRELVPAQVQVLRVVQLCQQLEQELVQDLGLSITETQQIVREVKLRERGAIRENHVQGL